MTFAFDLDGTITSGPEVYGELMCSLKKSGHTVLVLTGSFGGDDAVTDSHEARTRQLQLIGIEQGTHYDVLEVIVLPTIRDIAKAKANKCHDAKVDMFFDDRDPYLWATAVLSPKTVRVQPHRT